MLIEFGLGLQEPSILLLLLSMNVLVGLFVIHGLHQLGDDLSAQRAGSVLTVILLLLTTSFLLMSDVNSRCIIMFGTFSNSFAPSWRHFVGFSLMVVVAVQWTYHHEKNKQKQCVASPLWWVVIMFCILILCCMLFLHNMFIVPMLLHLLLLSIFPLALCRISQRPVCKSKCRFFLVLFLIFLVQVVVIVWILQSELSYSSNWCFILNGSMWFNPFFVIINIVLCFTEKWTLMLLHNFRLVVTAVFGIFNGYLCFYLFNFQPAVYCLLFPVYVFLLFRSIPSLKSFGFCLIGMTLVEFDLFSDFLVSYYFWNTEPIFAALQIAFVAVGQITGAVADVFGVHCISTWKPAAGEKM